MAYTVYYEDGPHSENFIRVGEIGAEFMARLFLARVVLPCVGPSVIGFKINDRIYTRADVEQWV